MYILGRFCAGEKGGCVVMDSKNFDRSCCGWMARTCMFF